MCRALKVLCAAPDPDRLMDLKRTAVSVHWEFVGGATTPDELADQVERFAPDVVVIDASMGAPAVEAARGRRPTVRIVTAGGAVPGADAGASTEGLKEAILGLPPVGGPVRS